MGVTLKELAVAIEIGDISVLWEVRRKGRDGGVGYLGKRVRVSGSLERQMFIWEEGRRRDKERKRQKEEEERQMKGRRRRRGLLK